jgi:hypothetical protein
MLIIAAIINILYGAWIAYIITAVGTLSGGLFFAMGGGLFYVCAAWPLLVGIIALIGAVFSIQRKHWGIALVGAILALISPGIIFGILALIFVIIGKDEYM